MDNKPAQSVVDIKDARGGIREIAMAGIELFIPPNVEAEALIKEFVLTPSGPEFRFTSEPTADAFTDLFSSRTTW